MKIVKPATLGLLQRTYSQARRHRFVATVLGFFTLGEAVAARLLPEAQQWGRIAAALAPMQALDEAMPKACGEVLVLGAERPAAPDVDTRLRVGSVDKRVADMDALGPLAMQSPQRQRHAGTYDARWLAEDWPGLARDLDWRLYNQAREDQRVPAWFAGGETYLLEGLHPQRLRIEGRLPTQRMRAFARRESLHEIALVFDTVWFFPALGLGACAWRGQLPVDDSDGLDVQALLVAYEEAAAPALAAAWYENVLRLRSDPDTAALHAFHESQLAPAQPEVQGQVAAQRALALARGQSTLPAPARAIALPKLQPPTPAEIASGDMDLTPLMQQVQALRAGASLAQAQQLAQAARALQSPLPAAPTVDMVLARAAVATPPLAKLRLASPVPVAPAQPLPPEPAARLGRQVLAWIAQGVPLAGRDLAGADLRGAQLAGADLSGCLLECADLRGADLRGAKLRGAALTEADLSGADCSGAELDEANLCGSQAQDASFAQASLRHARATKACWRGARAMQADLTSALLDEADLALACFDGATVDCTLLNQAVLAGGSWRGAQFRRCVAWKVDARGSDFSASGWMRSALNACELAGSRWQGARLDQVAAVATAWSDADLRSLRAQRCTWNGAGLRGADFRGAFVSNCDLGRADLQGAQLAEGCFARSVLMQAQCTGAHAAGADFFQALLRKSDFSDADLRGANLYQADLTGMRLDRSVIEGVQLHAAGRLA